MSNAKQRRLARPVLADDADRLARHDLEIELTESPELLVPLPSGEPFEGAIHRPGVEPIGFPEVLGAHRPHDTSDQIRELAARSREDERTDRERYRRLVAAS